MSKSTVKQALETVSQMSGNVVDHETVSSKGKTEGQNLARGELGEIMDVREW